MSEKDSKPEPKPQSQPQGGFTRDPNRIRPTNMRVAAFDSAYDMPQKAMDALRKVDGGKKE